MIQSDQRAKFLILESAAGELLHQSSEILAGCLERIEIRGFTMREVSSEAIDSLWLGGGFSLLCGLFRKSSVCMNFCFHCLTVVLY